MDVAAWLPGLGLERYAPAFLENRIEADILPSLTLEDLRDLGVTLVGDRRRLLDAIAALGVAISTPAASAPAVTAPAPAPADAERRQLTVMFCDLVGSTALSTRHDPEDLRELIGDYHRAVSETVGRFDGFVAKYMGDGVLIYFGYPQAHEDDAERAVRAGLAVIEAVGRLPARDAESSGEPQQRFEALYGAWQSTRDNVSGGIAAAGPLSERLLRMAEREGDDGLRLQAHHSGWTTWFTRGVRQKLASTPTPGAFSTIRRSMRPIGSSMADTIPVFAPNFLALGPNRCSD